MSYKNKLLIITILIAKFSFSMLARNDINWIDYEDFGMNRGKFTANKENIIIYKKDGSVSGIIDKPMPDFSSVIDTGNAVLWNDNQLLSSVSHVGFGNITMNKRFYRTDVKLFSNYDPKNMTNMFSETYKNAYSNHAPNGHDYQIVRLSTIVFDAKKHEVAKSSDLDKIKKDTLIARVGGGINSIAVDNNKETFGAPYGYIAGGLNKVINTNGLSSAKQPTITIRIIKDAKTAIDAGTKGGDSGSPVYFYDESDKKWKLIAANAAGGGAGYGKYSYLKTNIKWTEELSKSFDDEKIDATKVELENNGKKGTIKYNGKSKEYISNDKSLVKSAKNQIFNGENATITVKNNVNTSISRFTFLKDATIEGNGTLQTAGLIVEDAKTLKYKLNIADKNILRKIGKGTLNIESNGQNKGELNIGEGIALLNAKNNPAFSKIRIATGNATVKLIGDNQLNKDNVFFGKDGGTLDLNGKNVEFNNIYHIDEGAVISNSDDSNKSTFTLSNKDKIVYLGSFKKNLDLVYKGTMQSELDLRGNSDIKGSLKLSGTNISFSGDNVIHGFKGIKGEDEYKSSSFKSEKIEATNSNLTINRAAKIESNIVADNSKLNILSKGSVLVNRDKKYNDENVSEIENEINNIKISGSVEFKNNDKENLFVNIESNNKTLIDAKLSGKVKAKKDGSGELFLNNEGNDFNGSFEILDGALRAKKLNSLGNVKYDIKEKGILAIDNKDVNLENILDKIETKSKGVLSLSSDLESLNAKISEYSNLFLATDKSINIGKDKTNFNSKISKLNLGGDGGSITLKGELISSIKEINVGNSYQKTKIIISKLSDENSDLSINIAKFADLEILENSSSKKLIHLSYGSAISDKLKNNLKESSDGVLLIESNSNINLNGLKNIHIGASKGKTLDVSSIVKDGEYRFSGEGNINVNFALENKDLILDANYLKGAVISFNKDSENYKSNVFIQGNKEKQNHGDITLKLASKKAIGDSSTINLKNNGILDLNGFDLNLLKITDDNSTQIVSNEKISNLAINSNEDIDINSNIKGKVNIILNSKNLNNLEFKNEENDFTGIVAVINGTLSHNKEKTLSSSNYIYIAGISSLKINDNLNSNVVLATKSEKAIDLSESKKSLKISKISLSNNSVSTGNSSIKEKNSGRDKAFTYTNLDLSGNEFKLKNQFFTIDNISSKGSIFLDNSTIKVSGTKNRILSNSNFDKIVLKDSIIETRDYAFMAIEKDKEKEKEIEILGNSYITNGAFGDNGGGQKSTFSNDLILDKGNTLNLISKNAFNQPFNVLSNIKGDGDINIETSDKGIVLKNNFGDFNGTVTLLDKAKISLLFLNEKAAEKPFNIKYKLKSNEGAEVSNDSRFNITFEDLNEYRGTLVANIADITLDGKNALKTSAKIKTNYGALQLKTDEYVETENLNVSRLNKMGFKQSLTKTGLGELVLKDGISLNDLDNIKIDEGILTLNLSSDLKAKNSLNDEKLKLNENISYEISDKSYLKIKNLKDIYTDSKISGLGNLLIDNKNQTFKIDSSNLNHEGDINILSGNLEINLDTDKTMQNLVGNGLIRLSNFDEKKVTFNKKIDDFNGTIDLNYANLDFNIQEDAKIKSRITGQGEISNISNNELEFFNIKDFRGLVEAVNGDIKLKDDSINTEAFVIAQADKKILLNTESKDIEASLDKIYTKNIVKTGNKKLSLNSSILNEGYNFDIKDGIVKVLQSDFDNKVSGNINIDSVLEIENKGYKYILDNISGFGKINVDGGIIEFENAETFNGTINTKSSIKLVNEKINVKNPFVNANNAIFEISNDTLFNSNKINAEKITKEGAAKLTLDVERLNDVDNLKGEIYLNKDLKLNNLTNFSTININNKHLSLNKYKGSGILKLSLNGENKYRIKTNENGDLIKIELENLNKDILKKEKIKIAESLNDIKILNINDFNEAKFIKLNLQKNSNKYMLALMPDMKYFSLLNTIEKIYVINNLNKDISYDNNINVSFVNIKNNEKEYTNYKEITDLEFKNNLNVKGINLALSKNFKNSKDFKLQGFVSADLLKVKNNTEIKNNENYITDVSNNILSLGLNGKYKNLTFGTNIGLNFSKINKDNKKLIILNNEYRLGALNEFKLSNNLKLSITNDFEFKYQPKIYDNLSDEVLKEIKITNPYVYSYILGLKLDSKYFDMKLASKISYDKTKVSLLSESEKLENEKIRKIILINSLNLKLKLSDKLNVNFDSEIYNKFDLLKLGLGFSYKY